jgi:hypothetical protein
MIILTVLKVIYATSMVINLGDAFYRIITEKDRDISWKTEAIADIIRFIMDLTIFAGLMLEW